MGKIFTGDGWIIKVHGNEHPPVHAHLLHPDGKAVIATDGSVVNSGVPAKALAVAVQWMAANIAVVDAEWTAMNNPRKR